MSRGMKGELAYRESCEQVHEGLFVSFCDHSCCLGAVHIKSVKLNSLQSAERCTSS